MSLFGNGKLSDMRGPVGATPPFLGDFDYVLAAHAEEAVALLRAIVTDCSEDVRGRGFTDAERAAIAWLRAHDEARAAIAAMVKR